MGQIKDGKHTYVSSIKSSCDTLLDIIQKLCSKLVGKQPYRVEKVLRETITAAITNLQNDGIQEKDKLLRNNRDVLEVLKTIDFHRIQKELDD